MKARRIIVGYVELEDPADWAFRNIASWSPGDSVVADDGPQPVPGFLRGPGDARPPEDRLTYWCLADKPGGEQGIAAIYRTSRVPENAECVVCGVSLRHLQAVLAPTAGGN